MDLFGKRRIAQLEESLAEQKRLSDIQQQGWKAMEARYKELGDRIAIHNRALGRFIAKLDPLFASNEFDPTRKAESDRIAGEVIRKLIAEHKASSNPHDS